MAIDDLTPMHLPPSAAAVHENLRALGELARELWVGVLVTAALPRPDVMSGTPTAPEDLAARGYARSIDRTVLLRRCGDPAGVRPRSGVPLPPAFDPRWERFQLGEPE